MIHDLIKRTVRSSMLSDQKKVNEIVSDKKLIVAQKQVKSACSDLEKKFEYYRLSLYTYSLASLMEIMLGGNYKEEYVEHSLKRMLSEWKRKQYTNLHLLGIRVRESFLKRWKI